MENEIASFSGGSAQDTMLAVQEAQAWIEAVTGNKFPSGFRKSLENGILLCELMEQLRPGSILKINKRTTPIAHLDNLKQFLSACEAEFGLRGGQLFEVTDLQDPAARKGPSIGGVRRKEADRRIRNVCVTLYWLGRSLQTKTDYSGPQLCLEAFENIMSGEDVFALDDFPEDMEEVTVTMTNSGSGFGFQIVGGSDCSVPATVDRVVVGGAAEARGVMPNDIIISVNGTDVTQLSHLELIRLIKQSGSRGSISMGLLRQAAYTECNPPTSNAYQSTSDSPQPDHKPHYDPSRKMSEEHVAKSEILVHAAQQPNTVYVGASSGEESEGENSGTLKDEQFPETVMKQTSEESDRKQQRDRELRQKQQEEMAQMYPTKYSWGSTEQGEYQRSSPLPEKSSVFDKYGGSVPSPVGTNNRLKEMQLQKELKCVSSATSQLRQKWQKEETRAASLSPVMQRKQITAAEKKRKSSVENLTNDQDNGAFQELEEQLKKLQFEAKQAREETEELKRAQIEQAARIRREEQERFEQELKKQSMDTRRLFTEMQQQQEELIRQQHESNKQNIELEHEEIRKQLEEQKMAIKMQWQKLDEERKLVQQQKVEHGQNDQQHQQQQPRVVQGHMVSQKKRQPSDNEMKYNGFGHSQYDSSLEQRPLSSEMEELWTKQQQHHMQKSMTPERIEVEQRREKERKEEMQRQIERLQRKTKSPSQSSSVFAVPTSPTTTPSGTMEVSRPIMSSSQSSNLLCARCYAPLGFERAMQVANVGLNFHLKCFICTVCHAPLATGLERTSVLIHDTRLHCKFCFSTGTGLLATEC